MTHRILTAFTASLCLLASCSKDDGDVANLTETGDAASTVSAQQWDVDVTDPSKVTAKGLGGIHLNFSLSEITQVVLESVDGYQIAGDLVGNKESIITFSASEGGTLEPGRDYYIVTFPCDLYGGYRLTIYKDGLKADYFCVHQIVEAGSFITPTDLVESDLEFTDPDAPFVEDARPALDNVTQSALAAYQNNPTQENKDALMEQMGVKYDKVVARKKAKLRELERDAKSQSLVDEMQAIVDEMTENRDIRLEEQFLRLIDPRTDDDATDEWLVLRGSSGNNAYIGYAPVRNSEYADFKEGFTFTDGQDDYPVTNISYSDALAYCQWMGEHDGDHTYRLPTEEEWILAAGHMPKDVSMNSDFVESGLTSVSAYAQSTGACGGIDFWGNCWEWTSTQNSEEQYIVKGGSWDSSRDACRTEYSDDARDGNYGYANVGFRIVREDYY